MEKKLALLLGVLLLLHVAQFFGADLQAKANETTDTDPITSSDSENRGNSNGESIDSNSNLDHNEGKKLEKVKKDKDQVGGTKGDGKNGSGKPKSNGQKKLRNVENLQEGNEGTADENGKKQDDRVGPKEEPENAGNKEDNSKGGIENRGVKSKSSEEAADKSHNVEKGNEFSGDGEDKNGDEIVGPKVMPQNEGNNDQTGGSKGDVENGKIESNLNREKELEGDGEERKGGSSDGKNEKQGSRVEPEKVPKKTGNSVDECYFSIKCNDKENKLIACLRVPGNAFKMVEVSIGNGGTDSVIILTAGNRICNLDFKDLISQNSSPKFAYLGLPARRPTIAFMSFSVLLIMVSAWIFVTFRRRKLLSIGGFAYQKIDVGLPVSVGGKQRLNNTEGWDESWGDGWDDEEAPMTPSMPSPSLSSSKRLASRRLSKETRKD
ncbi:hypothetical protein TorRG33x02_336960 [Trema orientale]|uniref:Transmembrane protein n=1 Tax=Trema orientale TaxID=63057 RepID=A0A2P5AZK4_TREOI|nr:hypothetical protein TorRG33x02_336960 [Trema orientale]